MFKFLLFITCTYVNYCFCCRFIDKSLLLRPHQSYCYINILYYSALIKIFVMLLICFIVYIYVIYFIVINKY